MGLAADERARGNEAAQRVRAQADRTAIEIVSEAERDAQIIRGESDAERNRILADAYGANPEFFAFYQAMERGTSWFGTLTFGLVYQLTLSYRWAVVALIGFFLLVSFGLVRLLGRRRVALTARSAEA